jgi:hypothetical protein
MSKDDDDDKPVYIGGDSNYPLAGGGRHHTSHDDRVAQHNQRAAAQKKVADAAKIHAYFQDTLKVSPPLTISQQVNAARAAERDAEKKKAEVHQRKIDADKNLEAWDADNERRAKAKTMNELSTGKKVTASNLQGYSSLVMQFTDELHKAMRDYPDDTKIQAFAKEARGNFTAMFTAFDRSFQAGLKIASGMYRLAQGSAASASGSAGGVDLTDVVNEMVRSLHDGAAMVQSGRGLVHDNDFTSAFADAISAHASFVAAANSEAMFSNAMSAGATRIVDLLHEIENDCESLMSIVDSAVTGGKIAAIFPTVVDSVEATSFWAMGQEHKTWQEISSNGLVDLLFLGLDKYMKEPVTDELKKMIDMDVKKLTKGIAKKIVWADVYTAATESYKTLFKAITGEY